MFVVLNMPSKWHPLSVTYHIYITWLDSCRRNMDPSPTVDSIREIGFSDAWKSNFHFCPSGKLFTGFSSLPLLHLPLLHQTLHRCSCAPGMCKVNLFDSVWKADLSRRPLLQASRVYQRAHISHCKVKEVLIKGHIRGTTAWVDVSVFVRVKESEQENLNCSSHSLTCSISLGFRSLRSSYSSLTYIQEK